MSDFKVQGQIGLDGSGFFSTLGRAEGSVKQLGSKLAAAFSVGAITAFSKSVLDLAGKLNDVSEALSINVEFLQKFLNSAAKRGGSLEDIEKFIFESNKARQAAVNDPKGKDAGAFQRLGFSQQDISSLNPQAFIEKLIQTFKDGATPQQINDLSEIGGKAAKKLVGGFKDGLDEATAIMSQDVVEQLDEVGDRFTSIGTTLKSVFAPVLVAVAGGISNLINEFQQLQAFVSEFVASLLVGDGFGKARRNALAAAEEVDDAQRLAKIEQERTRAAKREATKQAQEAKPEFEKTDQAKKTTAAKEKAPSLYSDSRVAIGDFLGANRASSLESIAQQQLDLTRTANTYLAQIATNLASSRALNLIIP